MMQQALKRHFRVGDAVSFLLGGRRIEGLVVEDRGPLAGHGRRLYRVLISPPSEEPVAFEMPEDEMALHGARRALFTEFANRVVEEWWHSVVGGPLDHLTGYQTLARVVNDNSEKIAERVRDECEQAAGRLGHRLRELQLKSDNLNISRENARRVSYYARQHGVEGLHEKIEEALWAAAAAQRESVLNAAEKQGWHRLVDEIRLAPRHAGSYPLLAFLADGPQLPDESGASIAAP
jgi:hypothetical protein